ncbi:type II toxin-antitoxin system MqsA family antitoxin [Metallumcola ferriviriculae]|uniref:Type II toxin-antitoxin system MqsA family antitoxin n=1 Tax=Metallumcola ferriviriculae TaxID=3039180 RepID=A0AAU0UNT4_9FIRM|nr:type II toxin-antitoxin system MqsA family antitoxin [Desulfitibacteraceae bacterium MK1]
MNCIACKANVNDGEVNHTVDIEGRIIVVKNVPAKVCQQCGDYYIAHDTALKLEEIVEEAKGNGAEITIINYHDRAA